MFVLFAEDKGLISTNSVVQIVEKWQALRDDAFDTPRPLYALVLLFFNNLYLGKKDNNGNVLIPEFGGELFAPDEVLDQLTIDDDVLKDDLLKLSQYDFNTDVDVNILGHIFEHSLNEVDDVEAELRGEQLDKTKSKRKKDGVFYTPKYITKYIVDNTLGKLCSEKKSELKLDIDIFIDDFQKTDGKLNEKGKDLFERLNIYKSWLLTVKVCDPACGSGAFLNQALSFFIEEHKFVDDLIAELTNSPLRLFDTDLQILENNIYGVDINEESVEIAKLSLWLRTAQPGRKLSNLSNNIKCGNSLIDDPAVAGDKAFNWGIEFPSVFIEKNKFAFHITTSLHDSRTSPRMLEFKVRERRFDGSKPNAEVNPLTKEEEELIATTVSEIAKEDDLNIAAFNLCRDHMHILLVCEEGEISSIMQKIKAKTARAVNILRGITKVVEHGQTSPNKGASSYNKGAGSLDEIRSADSRNKGAGSYNKGAGSYNKGAGSLDEIERETSYNKGACSLDDTENTGSLDDSSAVHRIDTPRGEKQNSLWTQKFGCKPVRSDEQFWNTVHYIENNKEKHKLPRNPKLETIISRFVKTYEDCLKTEHTGGFDVVIGNPPWGAKLDLGAEKTLLTKYPVVPSKLKDSYMYFMLLCLDILKLESRYGLIVPNTWLLINNTSDFRAELLKYDVLEITDHGDGVFQDAIVESATIFIRKRLSSNNEVIARKYQNGKLRLDHIIDKKLWLEDDLNRIVLELDNFDYQLIKKMEAHSERFDKCSDIIFGIKPYQVGHGKPPQKREDVDNRIYHSNFQINGEWKPLVTGTDVNRYSLQFNNDAYIKYGPWLMYASNEEKILSKKILLRRTSSDLRAVLDDNNYYPQNSLFIITSNKSLGYIVGLLNSKLFDKIYKAKCPQVGKVFAEVKPSIIKSLPIASAEKNQELLIENAVLEIQSKVSESSNLIRNLIKLILSKFEIEKLSVNLQNWHKLEFKVFLKELKKANVNLSLSGEAEWMDYFNDQQKRVLILKNEINKSDKEIDRMVYELYGLTEEEIQLVENS